MRDAKGFDGGEVVTDGTCLRRAATGAGNGVPRGRNGFARGASARVAEEDCETRERGERDGVGGCRREG